LAAKSAAKVQQIIGICKAWTLKISGKAGKMQKMQKKIKKSCIPGDRFQLFFCYIMEGYIGRDMLFGFGSKNDWVMLQTQRFIQHHEKK